MKKSKKSFSLIVTLIAALAMIMLMTAVSFAAEGDTGKVGFGENYDTSVSIKVGETAIIKVSDDWNGGGAVYYPEGGIIKVDSKTDSGYPVIAIKPGTETISFTRPSGDKVELTVTVNPVEYTFDFDPGNTAYQGETPASGLNNVMQTNLKSVFGKDNASLQVISGIYYIKIKSDKELTYKDVLGEDGILEKSYAGADQDAFEYKIGFGCKASPDEYKDSAEFDAERNSEDLIPVTGAKFYALTSSHISIVELTVKEPKCGDKIAYNQSITELPAGAHPEVSFASAAKCSVFTYEGIPYAHWIKGETDLPEGEVLKGDTEYAALIALKPDFGYTLDEYTKVTINNTEASVKVDLEGVIEVTAPVTAVHDWDEGKTTKAPTTAAKGVKTFTCKACGETKTEDISAIKDGQKFTYGGNTYQVLSASGKTAVFAGANNSKSVTVPPTVGLNGETFKVSSVGANAFTGKNIRTVTIGANVSKISKDAFKSSKATTMVVKSKLLKKAGVKGSLKGSKIKTVKVKVGKKAVNKKYVKKYKKIFTKKNAGKKVTVK